MATIKKAQNGVTTKRKVQMYKGPKGETLSGEGNNPPFKNPSKDLRPYKAPNPKTSAKDGGKFPDLNKDGKITKADILKGRGVIAKNGVKKKMQAGGVVKKTVKKAGPVDPKGAYTKVQERTIAGNKTTAKAKAGAKMSKCKYGCN